MTEGGLISTSHHCEHYTLQPSIPKFSSFRSKAPASELSKNGPTRAAESERHKRKPSVSRSRHRDKSEKLKAIVKEPKELHASSTNSPDTRLTEENTFDSLFVIDDKGDHDNLIYGENSRHRVPAYSSSSNKVVLGERRRRWGFRPASRPLTSLGHFEIARLRAEGKQVHMQTEKIDHAHEEEFISLKRTHDPSKSHRAENHILGLKAWEDIHDDPDGEHISSSDELIGEDEKEHELERERLNRAAQARLSLLVEHEPDNAQAWLQYIDHQARWSDENDLLTASSSRDLKASVAEVKLAMFIKALKVVPRTNPEWTLLVSRMMEEAEKTLEPAKVAAKWKEWLLLSEDSPLLCVGYLNFVLRSVSGFQYEDALDVFQRCLKGFRQVRHKHLEYNLDELEVYILLRLTVFMEQAGMRELAIGLWQSVLEIKFFSPAPVNLEVQSTDEMIVLKSFAEFFDNEQPRIGETGASGWCNAQHAQYVRTENKGTGPQHTISLESNPLKVWGCKEVSIIREHRLPGRTSDATDDDDPYHVILFPDIQPYLEALRLLAPGELIVDAFLYFLRMPPLPQSCLPESWRVDPFLTRHTAHLDLSSSDLQKAAATSSLFEENQESIRKTTLASTIPRVCRTTTETLFAKSLCNSFENVDQGNAAFVRNVLQLLVQTRPHHDELAEYYLAYNAAVFPEEARKDAKILLKQRNSNLRLYNAYALIEARQRGDGNSDRVFSTALSMSITLERSGGRAAGLLRRTWAWEALRKGDDRSALQRLGEGMGGLDHTALQRDMALQAGHYNEAATLSECLALIGYLSNRSDLAVALQIFETELNLLEAGAGAISPAVECLHQHRAQLLAHHIESKHFYKPALIRAALQESINAFPNNTIFLLFYVDTEARFRIDDRVRQVLHDSMPTDKNVLHWAYVIENEIRRAGSHGSTSHSLRSTFEAALASRYCGSSAMLWTFYFHITHRSGDYQHAKAIFYRGLRAIPWVKDFSMLAFTHLRDILSTDELLDIHSTMVDRGLRLHVDLEQSLPQSIEV